MPNANGLVEQCSCGVHYPVGGAAMCAANNHGKKKGVLASHRHENFVELSSEVFCAECSSPLSAELKLEEHGRIVVRVLPHICAVADPEESVK